MPVLIALGSNLEDREKNLKDAILELSKKLNIEQISQVYESAAVDYLNQPDFYNMVIQCETPNDMRPMDLMNFLLTSELKLGRRRDIPKGPRTIDLDLLFFDLEKCNNSLLELPHPRIFERSFVVLPLKELSYSKIISQFYELPNVFENSAQPKFYLDLK